MMFEIILLALIRLQLIMVGLVGLAWADQVPGQAHAGQDVDEPPGWIEFKPAMAVLSATLVGMVVVVPTFAERQVGDPPGVGAVVSGFVVAIPPFVADRIDGPGDMQGEDGPGDHSPGEPRSG